MALEILKVTLQQVRVRITTTDPSQSREYSVDRENPGPIGAMLARADNGDVTTIGNFRTRDGTAMQADYARLRKLVQ